MKEIEKDGFITREADLKSKSRSVSAKPITDCPYPKCEQCKHYDEPFCTVPIAVTKQAWLDGATRITALEKAIADLEETVIYALYGIPQHETDPDADDDINITWEEYLGLDKADGKPVRICKSTPLRGSKEEK